MPVDRILQPSIRVPLEAEFHYTETDPLAVSVELHIPEGQVVRWVVSRDLLFDGTEEPSGMADVRLWPSVVRGRQVVFMKLEVQGVSSLLEMDLGKLQEWLVETFQLVHPGTEFEHVDWDATLAALTEDGEQPRSI
ncbi:SsgA family sporulation/cell division regulator [Streptomyces sp. NPDC006333]|uniref:SsgA family sporulation/cell division regulator n=1 Tax=Streptomyces sp. NPDC006333 TaxID=3156753 RepID=UPI0033ADE053